MTAPRPLATGAGLLERLMATVRPEFRTGEEFYPPPDSPVFFQGICRIPACTRAVSFSVKGLCTHHYGRWRRAGMPDLEAWILCEDPTTRWRDNPPGCSVARCGRASRGSRPLCARHTEAWQRAGSPDLDQWIATARCDPTRRDDRECLVDGCPWRTDSPSMTLCGRHYIRWRNNGHPNLTSTQMRDWFKVLELRRNPYIRLHDLSQQIRLEIQFGLQRRHDLGTRHTPPSIVSRAVSWIRPAELTSLLDWDEADWLTFHQARPRGLPQHVPRLHPGHPLRAGRLTDR
ncbi:hypothetical protein ACIBQ1_38330 [Nonomuraea sp. NPDC050153]|uniref:hypothetical protein n=1 Tax=Nonomuraea sp. NPDC050153 TaxID=3364359 RepID=UPI0037B241B3